MVYSRSRVHRSAQWAFPLVSELTKLLDGTTPHWILILWDKSHHNGKGQAEATEITTTPDTGIKTRIALGMMV